MWLLTCDGDLWGGKSRWLRPGSSHLFGRTTGRSQDGARVQYIDHKTVSRRHIVIQVGEATPSDSAHIHTRTEIKLTDASKAGTTVNDQRLSKETMTLDGKEYRIKLGSYEPLFHLKWHPVTFACTNLEGKAKAKAQGLNRLREKLAGSDIKLAQEYFTNETTHLAAKKRNTPTGLQALVSGSWMVTYDYIEALATAIQRHGVDENGDPKPCALEMEFEDAWPKEEEYIIPAGAEPVPRDNEYLKPRSERAEVFSKYTFVFLSQGQYDNLLPVITGGGGKALFWEATEGQSKVGELVDYVRSVAGKKGDREYRLSQHPSGGGVVVVCLNEESEWATQFGHDACLALDQTAIAQNEFLDAILKVDASDLRRQLPESESVEVEKMPEATSKSKGNSIRNDDPPASAPESPAPAERAPETEPSIEEKPTAASKKRNRRGITQSRFKGFDDFDPSQFSNPPPVSPGSPIREPSEAPSAQNMDVDEASHTGRTRQGKQTGEKRSADVLEERPKDDYGSLLQGQAAMKRRKLESKGREDRSESVVSDLASESSAKGKKKKKTKEVDVRADLLARRQKEDAERRKDEEAMQEAANVDISELKDLAKIEIMELPVRERPARSSDENGHSDRWDPSWNGRRNFKKFRPQGESRDGPRLNRVIVRLDEVPRKGNGIGDEYWLQTTTQSSKSKSQSQSQSVRQAPPSSDDTGDVASFRRRIQQSHEDDAENEQSLLPEEVAGTARDTQFNPTPSQTLRGDSQKKRPATSQGGGPAKKARQTRLAPAREPITIDDDDDDDGLKFRRRKR